MQGFKFIHTADVHLDRPFQGIGQLSTDFRERLLEASFQAFCNLVNLALQEKVDFLVIAGDLFHGTDLSLQAQIFCQRQFQRLTQVGIQVYLVHGNHDHLGSWRADLEWPEGVFVFPAGQVASYPVVRDGGELARIYGVSYPEQHVQENYVPLFQVRDQAPYRIGLLHTNVGSISGHANYAPCTLRELLQTEMDYWALGHVHSYQLLHSADPVVIYPGTPQGRHPGETGPKGCCLVEVASDGSTDHKWVEVDQLRWHQLTVEIDDQMEMGGLIQAMRAELEQLREEFTVSSGNLRDMIVRIKVTGRGQLHTQLGRPGVVDDLEELYRDEFAAGSRAIWVESIRLETQPDLNLTELRAEESLLGDFLNLTQRGQELDPDLMVDLEDELAGLLQDRRLQKIIGQLDSGSWQRLIRKCEDVGLDLFGLEVDQ